MLKAAFSRVRKVKAFSQRKRTAYYLRRAMNQLNVVILMLLILAVTERAAGYSKDVAVAQNKKMNFEIHNETDPETAHLNYETGEILDDTSPLYDERRWTFGWGVDMILRFEKGYTFCTSYVAVPAENVWPTPVRGLLYLVCLFYLFLGVAIISDVFMSGIEQITSQRQKIVFHKNEDGEEKEKMITYTVWNETVANLTLLALGSSAPEILLSILETVNTLDEVPGELGPSTIVGSAAFNLLCITAICTWALEDVKKIKEFGVFIITSCSSVFAYIWLLVVLQFNTPDVVDLWEAVTTFMFFPLLVLLAYLQDRRWFRAPTTPDIEETPELQRRPTGKILDAQLVDCTPDDVRDLVKAAKSAKGDLSEEALKTEYEKAHPQKLNRGHYRINAIRSVVAKQRVIHALQKRAIEPTKVTPSDHQRNRLDIPECGLLEFVSPSYSVLEGEGEVVLKVRRHHGSVGTCTAKYHTQDLTGVDGVHYEGVQGTLVFRDGDLEPQCIPVKVIDNDVRNADMLFTCHLETDPPSSLGDVKVAVVTIIDDDLPGEIRFALPSVQTAESEGTVRIQVVRENGCTGSLLVYYRTEDGIGKHAATSPQDYEGCSGHLHFDNGETSKFIEIPIVDDSEYEKEEHFFVMLTNVEAKSGGKLGALAKCRVDIVSDTGMLKLVQSVLKKVKGDDINEKVGTSDWLQQFKDAMNVGGDDDDEEPGALDYIMHFFTFLWKVLFAFVPPTSVGGGWACFFVSLAFIGLVTAMVSEVASLLGCVVGLKDSVTAITFVALGTSLPDTFASKQAAENEEYADAAVGNVTGSNSVNVFLGLGLPWVLASIYYNAKGECYIVPSGALAFSVTIFTITAVTCISLLFLMRLIQGGELGGPRRHPIALFLLLLWVTYVVMSSLKAYDHLDFPGTQNRCPCQCKNRGILGWSSAPSGTTGSCIDEGCPL